jgi:vesicle transport protein SEC22
LNDLFQVELQNTFGSTSNVDFRSRIETIDKQYAFIKFEKTITKKRKEFRDGNTAENLQKLNSDLMDVGKVLSESFEMLLDRDGRLK